jgi:hypothetical protein
LTIVNEEGTRTEEDTELEQRTPTGCSCGTNYSMLLHTTKMRVKLAQVRRV